MEGYNNRRIYWYSSLFLALALNMPKLFALRSDGLIARFWHFNGYELLFKTVFDFLFCLSVFFINDKILKVVFNSKGTKKAVFYILLNVVYTGLCAIAGMQLQQLLIGRITFFGGGYMVRLYFCLLMILLGLRILSLLSEARNKDIENERLRNSNLNAEMALLKAQLNPHFFFNALSSLSAVVRENPGVAQHYINHLSKVYRYSLKQPDTQLVSLKEELEAVHSYTELMKMRFENGFHIDVKIDSVHLHLQLPHMSLQPLLENAFKHNAASAASPLQIDIYVEKDMLVIANSLHPVIFPEAGTGIGLYNLNERYKLLLNREIEIIQSNDTFVVKFPLKQDELTCSYYRR